MFPFLTLLLSASLSWAGQCPPGFAELSDTFVVQSFRGSGSLNAVEGSLFSKLEIKRSAAGLELPKAGKINRVYGLDKKRSSLRFVQWAGEIPTIEAETYWRHLAKGEVLISPLGFHDVIDHATGFVHISKTKAWPETNKVLADLFKLHDRLKDPDLRQMVTTRIKSIGDLYETASDHISKLDRENPAAIAGELEKLTGLLRPFKTGMSDFVKQIKTLEAI